MHLEELNTFLREKVDDMKAQDIATIDVTGKSSITDFMIVCTGHQKDTLPHCEHLTKESKFLGITPMGINGDNQGEWVIVDMGSTIVHVMQEEQRELYNLEKLWG